MLHYLYTAEGKICQYDTSEQSAFVFQRMRTRGHKLLHAAEYIELINSAAKELFGKKTTLTAKTVEQCCSALLLRGNYSQRATHIVELRADFASKFSLRVVETSLYNDFQLRVVRPQAVVTHLAGDILKFPTSAAAAVNEALREVAATKGGGVVLCIDRNDTVTSIDGASPIAVFGKRVVISNSVQSVETEMVINAIKELKDREFCFDTLNINTLLTADELFYADSRGITAISSLKNRFYSDALAYAIAKSVKE